jgi:hypothetical protein
VHGLYLSRFGGVPLRQDPAVALVAHVVLKKIEDVAPLERHDVAGGNVTPASRGRLHIWCDGSK